MLSETTINEFIESIPPVPKIVKQCAQALEEGDLLKAAGIANEDRALMHYLQNLVNKPIFGFRTEVKNTRQIFGILGLLKAKQLVYGYYLLLILPKKWEVFDFDSSKFQDFQARLIFNWGKIVTSLDEEDHEIAQAISIIPAALVVCEMLFRDINETVKILRDKKQMSYEAILTKMTDRSFFEIASMIAKKWDFFPETIELIKKVGDDKEGEFGENALQISYIRLLIMFEMSRPVMVQSGLSDLFDFKQIFDGDMTSNFYRIIEDSKA